MSVYVSILEGKRRKTQSANEGTIYRGCRVTDKHGTVKHSGKVIISRLEGKKGRQ